MRIRDIFGARLLEKTKMFGSGGVTTRYLVSAAIVVDADRTREVGDYRDISIVVNRIVVVPFNSVID